MYRQCHNFTHTQLHVIIGSSLDVITFPVGQQWMYHMHYTLQPTLLHLFTGASHCSSIDRKEGVTTDRDDVISPKCHLLLPPPVGQVSECPHTSA